MDIRVRRDECVGAGLCVLVASQVFDQDDEGLVVALAPSVDSEDDIAAVKRAVSLCPAQVIELADGDRR